MQNVTFKVLHQDLALILDQLNTIAPFYEASTVKMLTVSALLSHTPHPT